jgi:isocitrate dehydrogenase kinase/phosphatase
VILRRRGRFDDVIQRQLDLFEQDHLDVIEEVVERMEAYNRADRDEAEEVYGDYVDAVETGTELLADIRDSYARMLEEGIDELYEEEFNRAVLKRWPPFADEIDLR